eukprot:comp17537_c0_seq1/m.17096 comp17537_c0_seq1/g.17096  ORF comp17537_c0_seq1/g.17096 comp17537_c0_seq1/m.17096 type:complete len:376 (-) comp17537_c0_seq1:417-1544(-)
MKPVASVALLAGVASAKILFQETFDDSYKSRWVSSTFKGAEQGEWKLSAGKFYADAEKDKGLQTSQDAKFYGISAKFDPFSNEGKDLVIQFSVKHEQGIDCGGGYVKVFTKDLDQEKMHGDTPYSIMFGPDICGSTKRVHVIFTYKGKNLLKKVDIPAKHDESTHLYTLIVKPDNTYEVLVDLEKAASGKLEEDWDFLPPKEIDDPDAKKPEDWDDEDDGEWEAPQIPNPEYKGPWAPKQIDNPAYKGKWVKPKIPNPEYKPDDNLYLYKDLGAIGLDLWQVKSGSIFDNILIADSISEAKKFAEETFKVTIEGEKKLKEEADKKAEEERKAKEAEEAAKKNEQKEDDKKDDDDDEEEEEEIKDEDEKKPAKDEL